MSVVVISWQLWSPSSPVSSCIYTSLSLDVPDALEKKEKTF